MSGGFFDYSQYKLDYIADAIDQLIRTNEKQGEYGYANNFSKETILEFIKGEQLIRKAAIYAQRIDWLVSGDDAEESFHDRLREDLLKYRENNDKTTS